MNVATDLLERVIEDDLYRLLIDYSQAAGWRTLRRSKVDWRIPTFVAEGWVQQGFAVLSTNGIARQYGITRQTVCKAIKRVVDAGLIHEIGRTPDGRAMYVPCLEIAHRPNAEGVVHNVQ